jgi:hypothetical protein
MGRKKPVAGLVKRGEVWHIDKRIKGKRISESCGTSDFEEAQRYLAHRMEEIRQAEVYSVLPKRTFREAATKYLNEATKKLIERDASLLKILDPFIGDMPLESIHMGSLQGYIAKCKADGLKKRSINYRLQVVRRILNLKHTFGRRLRAAGFSFER